MTNSVSKAFDSQAQAQAVTKAATKVNQDRLDKVADMKVCLLNWCMCTDVSAKVASIIGAQSLDTGRSQVGRKTLYDHFSKSVEINVGGDSVETTSLKAIKEKVFKALALESQKTVYIDCTPPLASRYHTTPLLDSFISKMATLKVKAEAVIVAIYENMKKNQKLRLKDLHDGNRVMTVEQEDYLAELCKILAQSGNGLNRDEVLTCMNELAPGEKSYSQNAVDGFFKRHPDLKMGGSSGIDPLRAAQANEQIRDSYFCKLDYYIESLHAMKRMKWDKMADIPKKNIYNMDELASDTTKRRNKVAMDSSSTERTFMITPEGDRMPFHVTICLTTRADGQFVSPVGGIVEGAPPPVIIHSKAVSTKAAPDADPTKLGKGHLNGLVKMEARFASIEEAYGKNNDHGFLVLATANGSMKQSTMLPYAQHFVKNLPKDRDTSEGVLLLMDGHSSRWDLASLKYFFDNNVYLFFFPSHTSIWSQPNDNGANMRLHNLIAAEATKRRRGISVKGKFTPKEWNFIFYEAWAEFLKQERAQYRVSKSNVSMNAFVKTGLSPFNPRCSTWTDAIENVGMYAGNQLFQSSYEVRPLDSALVVLETAESSSLLVGCHLTSVLADEQEKVLRAAYQRAKEMLARWRDQYEETRAKLLKSIKPSDSNGRVRQEYEFDGEQRELLKQLRSLEPANFALTEGDKVALKVVQFALCDIDSLVVMSPAQSEKESRVSYVATVLDQIQNCDSVKVQKLGESDSILATGTATKTGPDLWTLYINEANCDIVNLQVSTKDLAESGEYNVIAESLSLEATEAQKRQQRAANKRRRQEQERRRAKVATEAVQKMRDTMLRNEYDKLVSAFASGKSYEYAEFLEMEKKLTDTFESEVDVEGEMILAFANRNEAGVLNSTMKKLITEKIFSVKRLNESTEDGPPSKRKNTGRYVPTKNSEDHISGIEILEMKDRNATLSNRKKDKKSLMREHNVCEKFQKEIKKYQQKRPDDFFDVRSTMVKAHVSLIYRLFDGESHSSRSREDMKAYLRPLRIDEITATEKLSALDQKLVDIANRLESLALLLGEEDVEDQVPEDGVPMLSSNE